MAKKTYKVGVDLGTANILVYINGNGIVFNQPSVVAFDRATNNCIAVGKQASDMLGKEHSHIRLVRVMDGGVIADLEATKVYLEYVFKKLESISIDLKHTTLLLCCPSEVSEIERVALLNLAYSMGVKDAFVEEELKAGAIGAGIDIFSPRGSMVIDIGGGTTDIGVISLGDIVVSESVKVAGESLDREIAKYVKYKYGLLIGNNTAEQIKIKLGTLSKDIKEEKQLLFAGRSIGNGLPIKVAIKQSEIRDIIVSGYQTIITKVVKVLQQTPPELASDIFADGILLNGGGTMTEGVKEFFEDSLGLKVRLAVNPLTSIVEGTKLLLQNRGSYLVKPTDF